MENLLKQHIGERVQVHVDRGCIGSGTLSRTMYVPEFQCHSILAYEVGHVIGNHYFKKVFDHSMIDKLVENVDGLLVIVLKW